MYGYISACIVMGSTRRLTPSSSTTRCDDAISGWQVVFGSDAPSGTGGDI